MADENLAICGIDLTEILNDCIIAATAIEHGRPPLHADRDFTTIAGHTELEVVSTT